MGLYINKPIELCAMAQAEDADDILSLREFRRADRQAALTRVVDGYIIKLVPVIRTNSGQLYLYLYQQMTQGPLYKSPFSIDDSTRDALDIPEAVQTEANELLQNTSFEWPEALA